MDRATSIYNLHPRSYFSSLELFAESSGTFTGLFRGLFWPLRGGWEFKASCFRRAGVVGGWSVAVVFKAPATTPFANVTVLPTTSAAAPPIAVPTAADAPMAAVARSFHKASWWM